MFGLLNPASEQQIVAMITTYIAEQLPPKGALELT
jgi:hypothetical protein